MTSILRPAHLLDAELKGDFSWQARQGIDDVNPPIYLGSTGRCPKHGTLMIKAFDNSPSVMGGNDSIGNRFEEMRIALAHLSRRCRCGRELVALRTFDLGTTSDVGPIPITRKGPKELTDALKAPSQPSFASSNLGPSLADAERLATAYPDHQVVLIVLSDFELCDPDPLSVLQRLQDFAEAPNHQVHAVVLRSQPPAAIEGSNVVVTRVSHDSPRGAVARAVFGGMLAARKGALDSQ